VQLIALTKGMPMVKFDNKAFNLVLDTVRGSKGLNWKQVAEESGVSASTLSRIIMGKNPDVDSLVRLVHWCGVDFKHLVGGTGK
jgi:transcriptional regulator with XRE-family HTH domain